MQKEEIKNLSESALREALEELGVQKFRYDQIFKWLYQKDVSSFDEMSNLSKSLRDDLKAKYSISRLEPKLIQESRDGTRKVLFELPDGKTIESVLIPSDDRLTLCISSQVGCAMACSFCMTATLGLARNLSQYEIIEQVMACNRIAQGQITNLVFMGMGEPFHNYENVVSSIHFILDHNGIGLGKRKVTVSTCGLVPEIKKFRDECDAKLAISLTATTDKMRDKLIPVNKRYPLKELMQALKAFPRSPRESVTFEYTLLKDVNDSLEDAKRLVQLLKGVRAKVNLIPFNPFPGTHFESSDDDTMYAFQNVLYHAGIQTNIRKSRGQDILGACGQLKAAHDQKPQILQRQARVHEETVRV